MNFIFEDLELISFLNPLFSASPVGGPSVQGHRQHGEEPRLAEEEGQVHRKVSDYRVTCQFGKWIGLH